MWAGGGILLGAALLPLLLGLAGCGEQDLYKPPRSPYRIVAQMQLPSACEDVSIIGRTAYVAGGEAGLHTIDITDPAHPVLKQTLNTTKYAEAVKTAATPAAEGVVPIAFVVEGTEGITTYNIADADSTWSYNQGTTAVDGNGIFIDLPSTPSLTYSVFLAESWKGIRIFESDPQFPGVLRYNGVFAATRGFAKAVAVANGYAYVADDEMGLTVLDVRVRILGAVKVVSATDTPGNAKGIAISGDHAYIADGKNGLVVMRIDGGNPPVPVGGVVLAGDSRYIEIRGPYAFIAAQDGGVHIVDISNPANPRLAGTVITPYATGLSVTDDGLVAVSDKVGGLFLLVGPGGFPDQVPPAPVADLRVELPVGQVLARLRWTAPGDNGFDGSAASYDIRYSQSPITEANWDSAQACVGETVPSRAGTEQSFSVRSLSGGREYFFALKTTDDSGNVSPLSNIASATTPAENQTPGLGSTGVQPTGAMPGSDFVFEARYFDAEGDAPVRAEIVLWGPGLPDSGLVSTLTPDPGSFEDGVMYHWSSTLQDYGVYRHQFIFSDGVHDEIRTPAIEGPFVGVASFLMGSPTDEPGRDTDEPQHMMVLGWGVAIADHEVTQAEYEAVMQSNPSHFRGADLPVENVTWLDAVTYCNLRSTRESYTPAYIIAGNSVTWNPAADGYRLPTEAEWEWACRAGSGTALAGGALHEETCGIDPVLDTMGWYCGNAGISTHPVKTKQPNARGLYDMHGNVWEWCWDWYSPEGPSPSQLTGPASGSQRVIRGGSWYYFARDCRSAARAPYWPNSKDDIVGFRVALTTH
jgi:formylglycine-generating enzyme required for sulfatase activity